MLPSLLVVAAALVPEVRAADALRYDPAVDLPITLATGAVFGGLFLGEGRETVLSSSQPEPPSGLDSLGVTRLDTGIAHVSDALMYGSIAAGLGVAAWDGAAGDQAGARLGLYAEAFAINGALTEVTKHAVRRPRPYTVGGEGTGAVDDYLSFFSGHSSTTAAVAFTTARSIDLTSDLSPGARWALYGGATALSGTVAGLRVAAGKHWPSDVLVGLLVGASVGFVVPELHRSDAVGLSLAPLAGGAQASLGMRF